MSASCPICGIPWPRPLACCPCGFAPASIDGFEVQLKIQRKRAIVHQVLGLVMCAPLPLMYFLTTDPVWLAPMIASLGVCGGGVAVFARALMQATRATRRLQAVKTLRKLPAARIVDPD